MSADPIQDEAEKLLDALYEECAQREEEVQMIAAVLRRQREAGFQEGHSCSDKAYRTGREEGEREEREAIADSLKMSLEQFTGSRLDAGRNDVSLNEVVEFLAQAIRSCGTKEKPKP